VELRGGAIAIAQDDADADLHAQVRERFERVGTVVEVPEKLMGIAGACSGVGPAYWALLVEAQVDAAVRRGLPAALASTLVVETMAGSAELLRARDGDTFGVRREVTSPGGTTAQGLAALERGGVRAAFASAMDDVVGG
jgi:pyrroline-5-carboxylate reductase